MKTVGKWLYLIGLLIAAIAGLFSFQNMWLSLLLIIMGILAAIFFLDSETSSMLASASSFCLQSRTL